MQRYTFISRVALDLWTVPLGDMRPKAEGDRSGADPPTCGKNPGSGGFSKPSAPPRLQDDPSSRWRFLPEEAKLHPRGLANVRRRIADDDVRARSTRSDPRYRPLIAITESSAFYEASSDLVPELRADTLALVIAYHRLVADQRIIAEAIASSAFLHLTCVQRIETFEELVDAFEQSRTKGREALGSFESHYPARWFIGLKAPPSP